jgi:hypothetical protein
MITAVLLGPGVVTVLALILVVTTRIEHLLARLSARDEEPAEHAP